MSNNIETNPVQLFLAVYFYLLESELNNSYNELSKVKFQSEEANTDEHLKKYFQKYILDNNDISKTKLKSVLIKNDTKTNTIDISKLITYKIMNVFLPEELSKEQKEDILAQRNLYIQIPTYT